MQVGRQNHSRPAAEPADSIVNQADGALRNNQFESLAMNEEPPHQATDAVQHESESMIFGSFSRSARHNGVPSIIPTSP